MHGLHQDPETCMIRVFDEYFGSSLRKLRYVLQSVKLLVCAPDFLSVLYAGFMLSKLDRS